MTKSGGNGSKPPENFMYIHSRCHMDKPLWVKIDQNNGVLHVECSECKKPVGAFQLQPITPPGGGNDGK